MINYSLEELVPHCLADSTRLGAHADGGYVINRRIISKTNYLIGLGISDEWSFEEDFLKQNRSVKIFGLDFSVSNKINLKKIFLSLLQLLFLKKNGLKLFIRRVKLGKSFRSFWYQPNVAFIQKGVSDTSHKTAIQSKGKYIVFEDIIQLIEKQNGPITDNSIFVKMDIEMSEFRVIPELLKFSKYLNGMVVEFHDLDLTWQLFQNLIRSLKEHFYVTHIHGCNGNALIPNTNIPSLIEMTFLKKELINNEELGRIANYPLKGLDYPHTSEREEVSFTFKGVNSGLVLSLVLSIYINVEPEIAIFAGLMDTFQA